MSALDRFSEATRAWFTGAFVQPTPAQEGACDAISSGEHALVVAPTGSGKTLAAFLWSLDRLAAAPPPIDEQHRCRVLYVSPLKALAVDVERNLRAPLAGIGQAAARLGLARPEIRVGIRSVEQLVEAVEGDREVGAALAVGDGVDLVDDHRLDAPQRLTGGAGQQEEQ